MAPIKSSLSRSVSKLLGVFKDTDLSLRGNAQSNRVPPPPFEASGGTKTTSGDQHGELCLERSFARGKCTNEHHPHVLERQSDHC